ncbi:MAG: bifunctional nicotinamidase/pyrazinamidase [Kiloniellales bacterium]|nr:bifunctional nicotinamidase/pyrazinamidase [Kiloniellales bacterium]
MNEELLLVVDPQNDFCPGGALAVPKGDEIFPLINRLGDRFEHIIVTQDWHPAGHASFATSHEGKAPFETVDLAYGPQVLWPDHCVQGTGGAAFHRDLRLPRTELIIRKGFHKEIDSYSAFYENDHNTPTGLTGYLRERGFKKLFLCGLATDFCVKFSALDAIKEGFEATVFEDACRAIDLDGSLATAKSEMSEAGVIFQMAE